MSPQRVFKAGVPHDDMTRMAQSIADRVSDYVTDDFRFAVICWTRGKDDMTTCVLATSVEEVEELVPVLAYTAQALLEVADEEVSS